MVKFPRKSSYNVYDLAEIVKILRSPDGCPWDKEQTHESIRRELLEEAYEVVEAIDQNDMLHLREELGDVLLHVVFHAQIETERNGFTLDDVADGIVKKLLYRHPHVFADTEVSGTDEVLSNWDKLKQAERSEKSLADTLNNIARSLPSLWRAEKLLKKSQKNGVDTILADYSDANERIGNALLALVADAVQNDIDPEFALHNACERYIEKIKFIQS